MAKKSRPAPRKLTQSGTASTSNAFWLVLAAVGLIAINLFIYAATLDYPFVNYDDPAYVANNPYLQNGLTAEGVRWAFTTTREANWHPLTWLSHMLDIELHGLDARGHHGTNLLLHTANTLLFFILLFQLTRQAARAAFAAALFAAHPLRVESVAWISERKDVLSSLFWLLALLAYVAYVHKPGWKRYLLVFMAMAFGLMAKPMLVTLPIVLLLLDFWPFKRLALLPDVSKANPNPSSLFRIVLEKAPLFALTVASSIVTVYAQHKGHAVRDLVRVPLGARVTNALISYVEYIEKGLWPSGLAAFYPYRPPPPLWLVAIISVLLIAATVFSIRIASRKPNVLTGWLWYLVTLVPAIGLVQVGAQSLADRYTYIPFMGISLIVAWTIPDFRMLGNLTRLAAKTVAALVICVLAILARDQVTTWKTSTTLWEHALLVTKGNYIAHENLAVVLKENERIPEALYHSRAAAELEPTMPQAHYNLGMTLLSLRNLEEAREELEKAIALQADYADAHANLGVILSAQGKADEALGHYTLALAADPDHMVAHTNLGILLNQLGRRDEAFTHLAFAVRANPSNATAHNNLAGVLIGLGRTDGAMREYREAIRLNPRYVEAYDRLGWLTLKAGRVEEAIGHFQAALTLRPDYADAQKHLAQARAAQVKPSGP